MKFRRSDTSGLKSLKLLPPSLLLLLCSSMNAAFASTLPCSQTSLASAIGSQIVCGTITYDFTAASFNPFSTFGTPLQASDIVVNPAGGGISISVNPTSFTGDSLGNPIARSQGLFYADGTGTGYTTYGITFGVSITSPYWFNGVTTTATNLHFDANNGGADIIDIQKIVEFNSTDLTDPNNPYLFSADANTGQIDTTDGFDQNIPYLTSGLSSFEPLHTVSMMVQDSIYLTPTGSGTQAIWAGPAGFTQQFQTPEPVTFLSLGSALLLAGTLRRKQKV